MTLRSRLAKVALGVVGLVIVGLVVAALAQPPPLTIGPEGAAAAGAVTVNCLEVIGEAGTMRYVAAGTSKGLRGYELRRVGQKYQVKDITQEQSGQ